MLEQTLGKPVRALRVMLVDDRAEFRRAMVSLLNRQSDLEGVT